MSVNHLCREAYGIRGDSALTLEIELTVGKSAHFNGKSKLAEERIPEGIQLVHIKSHRQTDNSATSLSLGIGSKLLKLIFVEIERIVLRLVGNGLFATVSADKSASAAEIVDGKLTAVVTALTGNALDGICKALHLLVGENARITLVLLHLLGVKRRAVSTHHSCDVGTNDLYSDLLLKCAKNRVVEERAALNHYSLSKLLCRVNSYNLIKRVLNYANRKSGRDIFNGNALLLRLLDRGVHKYRTSRSQINGIVSEKTEICKLVDGVTQ